MSQCLSLPAQNVSWDSLCPFATFHCASLRVSGSVFSKIPHRRVKKHQSDHSPTLFYTEQPSSLNLFSCNVFPCPSHLVALHWTPVCHTFVQEGPKVDTVASQVSNLGEQITSLIQWLHSCSCSLYVINRIWVYSSQTDTFISAPAKFYTMSKQTLHFTGVPKNSEEVFAMKAFKPDSYIDIPLNSYFCWQPWNSLQVTHSDSDHRAVTTGAVCKRISERQQNPP